MSQKVLFFKPYALASTHFESALELIHDFSDLGDQLFFISVMQVSTFVIPTLPTISRPVFSVLPKVTVGLHKLTDCQFLGFRL